MKRSFWILALVLVLLGGSALAQATGIQVDGKSYTFYGDDGTYEADGKTFVIAGDSVTIREAGKEDRILPLVHTSGTEVTVVEDTGAAISQVSDSSVMSENSTVAECTAGSCVVTENIAKEGSAAADFSAYAKYGLSYDANEDALYFEGRRVRIFEDSYALDDNATASLDHFDGAGVIDVEVVREYSRLTGLRAITGTAFSDRDLRPWTQPPIQQFTAVGGTPMTAAEKKNLYAPYAAFGLTYEESSDTLFYQGQAVRRFVDIQQSNGESLNGGSFKGKMTMCTNDSGTIDITTVRDYSKPDAEGNGTLTGLVAEQGH